MAVVTREGIRVRIKRIKKGGGGLCDKKGYLMLCVKTLTMAPGGVETSVFQNTIVPASASVEFSLSSFMLSHPLIHYRGLDPGTGLLDEGRFSRLKGK